MASSKGDKISAYLGMTRPRNLYTSREDLKPNTVLRILHEDNLATLYWLAEMFPSVHIQLSIFAVRRNTVVFVGDKWSPILFTAPRIRLQLSKRSLIVSPPQYKSSASLTTVFGCKQSPRTWYINSSITISDPGMSWRNMRTPGKGVSIPQYFRDECEREI